MPKGCDLCTSIVSRPGFSYEKKLLVLKKKNTRQRKIKLNIASLYSVFTKFQLWNLLTHSLSQKWPIQIFCLTAASQHFIKVSCHKEVAQPFSKRKKKKQNLGFQHNWLWWASTPVSLTDTLQTLRGAVELWQYLHVNLHEGREFPLHSKRPSLG